MNISFGITPQQIIDRTKTVTRRLGWTQLKPGDQLNGCRKIMGRKKGEPIEVIARIEVTNVRREPLRRITDDLTYGFKETTAEGFPEFHQYHWPSEFVRMFCDSHKGCTPETIVTRIEFKYL